MNTTRSFVILGRFQDKEINPEELQDENLLRAVCKTENDSESWSWQIGELARPTKLENSPGFTLTFFAEQGSPGSGSYVRFKKDTEKLQWLFECGIAIRFSDGIVHYMASLQGHVIFNAEVLQSILVWSSSEKANEITTSVAD